ncbi:pentatricopeptide repeat-containing protein [Tripterygium wilfordii]|uniref:Pentatricopeptide repeat-containing protein n=2 Tax=Tripterygium wilfordii TaxID=458696 RepID=A0A7J7DGF7_TRIWF|nr:pentatricopeptide repeat-containing protein [Tripterygium wilfordii]
MPQLKQAHAQTVACGLAHNSFALSRILDFCADPHHGSITHAYKLFQHIPDPTICICNTMIKAFSLRNQLKNSVLVYSNMLQNGMYPDNYTLPYLLKVCARLQTCCVGESVHGHCLKLGFVFDIFVGNSLILMYCGFNKLKDARYVFDEIPRLSAVSWTVMISGYAKVGDVNTARLFFDVAPVKDRGIWGAIISGYVQNNRFKEGLYMFRLMMQSTDIEPDEAIFVSILCSCANLGALDTGIWIHTYLDRLGLPLSVRLVTSMIDMYCKCGDFECAKKLFDGLSQRDTTCWNAMISGMAIHGDGEGALKLFSEMEDAGVKPDDITFITLFSSCSYSGMVSEGLRILDRMCNVYSIQPKSEHYGCLVNLLSTTGHFEEAKEIILRIPDSSFASEEAVAWRALLRACCDHGQMQLAEAAAERLMQLQSHSGAYTLLANLYAAAGKHDDAERVRNVMKSKRVDKAPGCSSVSINGMVHDFISGKKTQFGIVHDCYALCSLNMMSFFGA